MRDLDWLEHDVLVVDDEEDNLDAFRFAFRKSFRLRYARSGVEALDLLAASPSAVVVADQRMPGMSGLELLRAVKARYPETYAILLTAYAELEVLIDAVNSGVVDRYVGKPWDSRELASVLRQGITASMTLRENRRMREQLAAYAAYLEAERRDPLDFGALVPEREAVPRTAEERSRRGVLEAVAEVARTADPVVIEGEDGVESEVVARAIHVGSPREERPLVAVSARAFPGAALERELFGWGPSRGEGAWSERAGRVELADGGTLWLHDPGPFTASLQSRLLRLLRDGVTERVGETLARPVDVRIVLSVTGTLSEAMGEEPLLPELEARLAVYPIRLAPLRERREEILPLAQHFLERHARRHARPVARLGPGAIDALSAHGWPGNVRELEGVVERAAILSRGRMIVPEHLQFPLVPPPRVAGDRVHEARPLDDQLDAIERRELMLALEQHRGNKAEVARSLGIHRTTLYYRLKKHGLDG
jgi:two-component system response regulator AtoC